MNDRIVEPLLRLILALIAIGFSFLTDGLLQMFIAWAVIFFSVGIISGVARAHLIFLLVVCAPVFAGSLLINAAALGVVHDLLAGAVPSDVLQRSSVPTIRLALVAIVIQTTFGFILDKSRVMPLLRQYGVRGQLLILIAASVALIDDIQSRVGRISDSYKARGLAPRTVLGRLARVPEYMRPLFVSVLATAVTRSDAWHNREILQRLQSWEGEAVQIDYRLTALLVIWAIAAAGIVLFIPSHFVDYFS